jgi:hypothetical protein
MPELTPQDFENSFSDDADLEAVKYYLSIGDDHTQLRVSTAMYAQAGNDDPKKITKDAEELRLGSIGAASRLRQALLLSMNQNTLQELATRVLDHDKLFEYAYISGKQDSFAELEKNDPVRGPVFAMIRQRGLLPNPPDLITGEEMKAASACTEVPRPDLPCELEAALRWAADAPEIPFKILNRAFFDWTTTVVEVATTRPKFQEKYRTFFEPGKTTSPKKLVAYAKDLIASKFGPPHKVDLESHLLFFATNFRPFWKKHAAAYVKLAKIKSTKNKASGVGGPTSGMRDVWKRRTDDFVKFAKGRDIPGIGSDDWDDFFNEFAKSQPEKLRTQKKIAAFVRTLLVRASQAISDAEIADIIKLLEAEGTKAVDNATIRSCLERLGEVMASSSTKKVAPPADQSI